MVENTHYTISGVPAGMTALLTKTSSTVTTLTLSGTALAHANINDALLTITFLDGVFTNTVLAANVTNFSDNTGVVDFRNPPAIVWTGTFTEAQENDGTLTG